eukprot:1147511-Rhodomonas_salina.1
MKAWLAVLLSLLRSHMASEGGARRRSSTSGVSTPSTTPRTALDTAFMVRLAPSPSSPFLPFSEMGVLSEGLAERACGSEPHRPVDRPVARCRASTSL